LKTYLYPHSHTTHQTLTTGKMLDENLVFITLVIVFLIFIIRKQPELIAILFLVYLAYRFYSARFTNPREFITWLQSMATEAFTSNPCTNDNQAYCGTDTNSDMTFFPSYLRGMAAASNSINQSDIVSLKAEDYQIDKRLKMRLGTKDISIDTMIIAIPVLLDYKLFLEKVIKFTLGIKTDDPIQRNFLARKLQVKMSRIFYNAYNTLLPNPPGLGNTVVAKIYPLQSYNELLLAERQFDDTLNIFIFLGLDDTTNYTLAELQKEFSDLNNKLNTFVAAKVNEVAPADYNMYYNKIPEVYEPLPANSINM